MGKEVDINEFISMVEEIGRFIKLSEEKSDEKSLFGKNLETLKEIVTSEYEIIAECVSNGNTSLEHILYPTEQFLAAANESNYEKMMENYQTLLSYKQEFDNLEKIRGNKMIDVFQIDLKEMEIHQAKIKALQELVNIDLKMYGEVNPITLEILNVQHCELIDNAVVWEADIYKDVQEKEDIPEQENTDTVPQNEQNISESDVHQPEHQKGTGQSYKANVYMKNSGNGKQNPKVIYGSSPEDIINTLQNWNVGRTADMQFRTCYIGKLNTDTHKYENLAKYDVATGADITPIYLSLPPMERTEFIKTVDQLKKDGARYNPDKKKFFVTKQSDLNKFAMYLPKDSVSLKLNQNKAAAGANKEAGEPVRVDRDYSR